jgi:hypothetical protein
MKLGYGRYSKMEMEKPTRDYSANCKRGNHTGCSGKMNPDNSPGNNMAFKVSCNCLCHTGVTGISRLDGMYNRGMKKSLIERE